MDISPVAFQPVTSGATSASGSGAAAGSAVDSISASAQAAPVVPAPQNTEVAKPAAGTLSAAQLAQALKQVNDTFTQRGQSLYAAFEKDKDTGINVVKIVDQNTKEVISQFPSKEIIGFAQLLEQTQGQGGQFVHVKA